MAEITISCSHCGQRIVCDDQWAGQQTQCPACQTQFIVPSLAAPPPAAAAQSTVGQPSTTSRHKLTAGATQVTRSNRAAPISRSSGPRRKASRANFAGYIALAVILLVGGWAAFTYLPALIGEAKEATSPSSTTSSSGSAKSGGGATPLGEQNAAMDVSDGLDGGTGTAQSRERAEKAKRLVFGQKAPATNAAPAKRP